MVTETKIKEFKITTTSWLGRCPRCNGKTYLDTDQSQHKYLTCLYCGYERGILMPETTKEWNEIARNLCGNFGETLLSESERKIKNAHKNAENYRPNASKNLEDLK